MRQNSSIHYSDDECLPYEKKKRKEFAKQARLRSTAPKPSALSTVLARLLWGMRQNLSIHYSVDEWLLYKKEKGSLLSVFAWDLLHLSQAHSQLCHQDCGECMRQISSTYMLKLDLLLSQKYVHTFEISRTPNCSSFTAVRVKGKLLEYMSWVDHLLLQTLKKRDSRIYPLETPYR